MNGGISLESYLSTGDGYGMESQGNVDALNKALSAGSLRGGAVEGSTSASGTPLKVESLEKTLKVITFTQKNIIFWKDQTVLPAYNTVEEYNKQISYGADTGGFIDEGELPEEYDGTYVRQSQLVKYLGNTRVVTHPMTLVQNAHGNTMQMQQQAGTLWILQRLEPALFTGNETLVPNEFNGLFTQQAKDFATDIEWLDSDVVVDCRGKVLDEAFAETGSNAVTENYGFATDLYATPRVLSDFVKTFYSRERVSLPSSDGQSVGMNVTRFKSNAGDIQLKPDVFLKYKPAKLNTSGATSSKASATPTKDGTTPIAAVAATVTNSKWATADAGSYMWAVSSFNKYGESALEILSTTPTAIVASGAGALKFSITDNSYPATGFRIYRSEKGATYSAGNTKFYPLFDISAAQRTAGYHGGGASVVYDLNRWLPLTTKSLMIQRDVEVHSFKQLAPLMKMDLAVLSPAFRFMVLLYGTPMLYAPRKMVTFINVGTTFS